MAPVTSRSLSAPWYAWNVGMALTPAETDTSSSSSTSTVTNVAPRCSLLSSSKRGAIFLHGLHHPAVKSTTRRRPVAADSWRAPLAIRPGGAHGRGVQGEVRIAVRGRGGGARAACHLLERLPVLHRRDLGHAARTVGALPEALRSSSTLVRQISGS